MEWCEAKVIASWTSNLFKNYKTISKQRTTFKYWMIRLVFVEDFGCLGYSSKQDITWKYFKFLTKSNWSFLLNVFFLSFHLPNLWKMALPLFANGRSAKVRNLIISQFDYIKHTPHECPNARVHVSGTIYVMNSSTSGHLQGMWFGFSTPLSRILCVWQFTLCTCDWKSNRKLILPICRTAATRIQWLKFIFVRSTVFTSSL